jgi:hypothetical protein
MATISLSGPGLRQPENEQLGSLYRVIARLVALGLVAES